MLAVTTSLQSAISSCDSWSLRLDKFSFERGGGVNAKTEALKLVAAIYAKNSKRYLSEACVARQRLLELLQYQHVDRFAMIDLFLESKLLLHLGRASVLENVGLYAERITGLPMIPGTALKGLLSTWACWEANQKADASFNEGNEFLSPRHEYDSPMARRVFGDDSESGSESSGEIIFVGGFPTSPPSLGLDIVNPHYDPDGGDKKRLTPNPFLCVEPGTLWRFAFFVRPGAADADALKKKTADWLCEALTQIGIGAKSAGGYGRFRKPNDLNLAQQAELAEQAKPDQADARERAKLESEKAHQQAAAQATLKADYPNDATFRNRVLDKLNPGQLSQLQAEIAILEKPENHLRREQLKKVLTSKDYKDLRKRLREKDWFPKDWLPS